MKIRAEITLKNDAICQALDELGWTQNRLSRETGLSAHVIGRLIRFDLRGIASDTFKRVAEALSLSIEEVAPTRFRTDLAPKIRYEYMAPDAFIPGHGDVRRMDIADELAKLPEGDREIIVRHHGLNGHTEETLEDIAKTLGVSRQRIHQRTKRAYAALRGKTAVREWVKG